MGLQTVRHDWVAEHAACKCEVLGKTPPEPDCHHLTRLLSDPSKWPASTLICLHTRPARGVESMFQCSAQNHSIAFYCLQSEDQGLYNGYKAPHDPRDFISCCSLPCYAGLHTFFISWAFPLRTFPIGYSFLPRAIFLYGSLPHHLWIYCANSFSKRPSLTISLKIAVFPWVPYSSLLYFSPLHLSPSGRLYILLPYLFVISLLPLGPKIIKEEFFWSIILYCCISDTHKHVWHLIFVMNYKYLLYKL